MSDQQQVQQQQQIQREPEQQQVREMRSVSEPIVSLRRVTRKRLRTRLAERLREGPLTPIETRIVQAQSRRRTRKRKKKAKKSVKKRGPEEAELPQRIISPRSRTDIHTIGTIQSAQTSPRSGEFEIAASGDGTQTITRTRTVSLPDARTLAETTGSTFTLQLQRIPEQPQPFVATAPQLPTQTPAPRVATLTEAGRRKKMLEKLSERQKQIVAFRERQIERKKEIRKQLVQRRETARETRRKIEEEVEEQRQKLQQLQKQQFISFVPEETKEVEDEKIPEPIAQQKAKSKQRDILTSKRSITSAPSPEDEEMRQRKLAEERAEQRRRAQFREIQQAQARRIREEIQERQMAVREAFVEEVRAQSDLRGFDTAGRGVVSRRSMEEFAEEEDQRLRVQYNIPDEVPRARQNDPWFFMQELVAVEQPELRPFIQQRRRLSERAPFSARFERGLTRVIDESTSLFGELLAGTLSTSEQIIESVLQTVEDPRFQEDVGAIASGATTTLFNVAQGLAALVGNTSEFLVTRLGEAVEQASARDDVTQLFAASGDVHRRIELQELMRTAGITNLNSLSDEALEEWIASLKAFRQIYMMLQGMDELLELPSMESIEGLLALIDESPNVVDMVRGSARAELDAIIRRLIELRRGSLADLDTDTLEAISNLLASLNLGLLDPTFQDEIERLLTKLRQRGELPKLGDDRLRYLKRVCNILLMDLPKNERLCLLLLGILSNRRLLQRFSR